MKEHHIEGDWPALDPGLVGLVQGVARLAGQDESELLGISSAAFCNYVFEPELNTHEPERREFSDLAALFSNYGPWESIAYYTGLDILEVNALSAVETLKVAVFELEQGRPLLSLTPYLEPTFVSGYRVSVEERVLVTQHGDLHCRDEERLQGDHDIFKNWLLLVRPGDPPDWAATQTRQRIDVLRWTVEHSHNQREFFQETCENYAPGLVGMQRFREFLDGLTDPAGVEYAERYIRSLRAARTAAATCLERWAEPIGAELAPETVGALQAAAESYAAEAAALANGANFVEAMAEAQTHEEAAIAALSRAAIHFPDAFEAL